MEFENISDDKNNNGMNKTFENKNHFLEIEKIDDDNCQLFSNKDIKAQTLSLFGIDKNKLLDIDYNTINSNILLKKPHFELENLYRERLLSLYKNKSKEQLLNYFIESEVNNIILRKEIEKNKFNNFKLENTIIDLKQENNILKNKIKCLLNNNIKEENYNIKYNLNKNQNDDNNLSLPNSSFVQKELNIQTDCNNLDIDNFVCF